MTTHLEMLHDVMLACCSCPSWEESASRSEEVVRAMYACSAPAGRDGTA